MKPNVLWKAVLLLVVVGGCQDVLLAAPAKAKGPARGPQRALPAQKVSGEAYRRKLLEKSQAEARAMMKSGKWTRKGGAMAKKYAKRPGASKGRPRAHKKHAFQAKNIEADLLAAGRPMWGKRPNFKPDPEFGTRGKKGREMSDAVKAYAEPRHGPGAQGGRPPAQASKQAMQKNPAGYKGKS